MNIKDEWGLTAALIHIQAFKLGAKEDLECQLKSPSKSVAPCYYCLSFTDEFFYILNLHEVISEPGSIFYNN